MALQLQLQVDAGGSPSPPNALANSSMQANPAVKSPFRKGDFWGFHEKSL